MISVIYSQKVELDERVFRDSCIDTIADMFCDETDTNFMDLSSDVRKFVYKKVGQSLIEYAEKAVIE